MRIGHRTISALLDHDIASDYADEYGEPGYSVKEDGAVLLGDWWCRDRECDYPERDENGRRKLHESAWHYPRLFAALEEQGYELEWSDEWIVASNDSPSKAYRTTADSYSWESSILWTDGDFLTPDDGIEAWIDEIVNEPRRCLPRHVFSDDELRAQGFVEYECGFESGWHPGQTDDPEAITRAIREERGEVDVLFKLSHVAQFDIGFCVFVRETDETRAANEDDDETDE